MIAGEGIIKRDLGDRENILRWVKSQTPHRLKRGKGNRIRGEKRERVSQIISLSKGCERLWLVSVHGRVEEISHMVLPLY